MELSDLLLTDVIFKRDANNDYILKDNEFVEDNLDIIYNRIMNVLNSIFEDFCRRKLFLYDCVVHIDYTVLRQALLKYSRDVFGQKRLSAIMKKIPNYNKYKGNLDSMMDKYGLKVSSYNPYIHRRVGFFMYWFSVLKPFHIDTSNAETIPEADSYLIGYFNELITYALIKSMLGNLSILENCNYKDCPYNKTRLVKGNCTLKIIIDEKKQLFQYFLYDTHYRNLSRSSLELFLSKSCIVCHCTEGNCPLNNLDYDEQNLMFIAELEE